MKNLNEIPLGIIVIAIIAVIALHNSANVIKTEILSAEANKKNLDLQLKICSNIDEHYGYASNKFYADKPIIILNGIGESSVSKIYTEDEDPVKNLRRSGLNDIEEENFEIKWYKENENWFPFNITSKISAPYYKKITFKVTEKNSITNELEIKDQFDLLIVVR